MAPWTDIVGANGPTYQPPTPLCVTTSYRRRVEMYEKSTGDIYHYSNIVTQYVDNDLANCHYDVHVEEGVD